MRRRPYAVAGVVLTLWSAVAAVQKPANGLVERSTLVHREVEAGYGTALRVAAGPRGNVHVTGWRERKIRVEARVELGAPSEADLDELAKAVAIVVDPSATTVDIATKGPQDKAWMKGVKGFPKRLLAMPYRVDYEITVPEYTSLAIAVGEGDTAIAGVSGLVGIVSVHGDVSLDAVSGATQVSAAAGCVTIVTADRSWRGGNLNASCSGDLTFRGPAGFSAAVDARAVRGITIADGGEPRQIGLELKGNLGNGGGGVTLSAGGTLTIRLDPAP